jgi:Diguanylate cyclase, GGDEF domain
MFDIDGFKQINDVHGHEAGDNVLKRIGAMLGRRLRDTDLVARIGGGELRVLLPLRRRQIRVPEPRCPACPLATTNERRFGQAWTSAARCWCTNGHWSLRSTPEICAAGTVIRPRTRVFAATSSMELVGLEPTTSCMPWLKPAKRRDIAESS